MKNLFDITVAAIAFLLLLPFGIVIAIFIKIDSNGPILFKQKRVGINGKHFNIFKFRTMHTHHEGKNLQITVGNNDSRISRVGSILRRYKLDEMPQILNILKGEMSFVGPRPEVPKYVNLYNKRQLKVLSVKPGITDLASISFINENEILGLSKDPEKTYIKEILPKKLELNLLYIQKRSMCLDVKLILETLLSIGGGKSKLSRT